jgi:hypothetical protein
MKIQKLILVETLFALTLLVSATFPTIAQEKHLEDSKRIPVIYSTDIFQPAVDADDHYDMAILGSLRELDLKALVFDMGTSHLNPEDVSLAALRQISAITGQTVPPWAVGLRTPLVSQSDKGEDQPAAFQGGVNLIIRTLRQSKEKVVLILVGSCRDFAAAYNREPKLFRKKVAAIYVNAGIGPQGIQGEWNVLMDPQAYLCLMESKLPIYWCPPPAANFDGSPEDVIAGKAFGAGFFAPDQAKLSENASEMFKNYLLYMLSGSRDEPIEFLKQAPTRTIPHNERPLCSTISFIHAAGRKIYFHNQQYIACSPEKAKAFGITEQEVDLYHFENIGLTRDYTEQTKEMFGNLQCYFFGCSSDKIGKNSPEPDGVPDILVRFNDVEKDRKVEKMVITAPKGTYWEYPATATNPTIVLERQGEQLDCFFSRYVDGWHKITLYFDNGTTQKFGLLITRAPFITNLKGVLGDTKSTIKVFRYLHPEYNAIMTSVVTGLLSEL